MAAGACGPRLCERRTGIGSAAIRLREPGESVSGPRRQQGQSLEAIRVSLGSIRFILCRMGICFYPNHSESEWDQSESTLARVNLKAGSIRVNMTQHGTNPSRFEAGWAQSGSVRVNIGFIRVKPRQQGPNPSHESGLALSESGLAQSDLIRVRVQHWLDPSQSETGWAHCGSTRIVPSGSVQSESI